MQADAQRHERARTACGSSRTHRARVKTAERPSSRKRCRQQDWGRSSRSNCVASACEGLGGAGGWDVSSSHCGSAFVVRPWARAGEGWGWGWGWGQNPIRPASRDEARRSFAAGRASASPDRPPFCIRHINNMAEHLSSSLRRGEFQGPVSQRRVRLKGCAVVELSSCSLRERPV